MEEGTRLSATVTREDKRWRRSEERQGGRKVRNGPGVGQDDGRAVEMGPKRQKRARETEGRGDKKNER